MRLLFLILCAVNIAVAVTAIWLMPDPMVTHYGADGQPDETMSPTRYAALMSGTFVAVVVFFLMPWIAHYLPSWMWNIPNRDYWLSRENRPRAIRITRSILDRLGVVLMLFFLLVQWKIFQANRADIPRQHPAIFWSGLAVLGVALVMAQARTTPAFRLPEKTERDPRPEN